METVPFNYYLMQRLLKYSSKYEINFQMWPKQYSIYISKDGIDLHSVGGYDCPNDVIEVALQYLDRINKNVTS